VTACRTRREPRQTGSRGRPSGRLLVAVGAGVKDMSLDPPVPTAENSSTAAPSMTASCRPHSRRPAAFGTPTCRCSERASRTRSRRTVLCRDWYIHDRSANGLRITRAPLLPSAKRASRACQTRSSLQTLQYEPPDRGRRR